LHSNKIVVYLYSDNNNEVIILILPTMSASYTNSRKNESFVKLRSNYGLHNELDIHGQVWGERAVINVTAFDRTAGKVALENANGLKWLASLKDFEFCTEEGDEIYNQ